MNELQSSFLYITPVINSLLRQGTWYKRTCSCFFRLVLWHSDEGAKEYQGSPPSGIKGVLQRRPFCMKAGVHTTTQPFAWAGCRGKIAPEKKHYRIAHSLLCITKSYGNISLRVGSTPWWPLRGNVHLLSCFPGRTVSTPPTSSALLCVKVVGDPQEFSRELVSLWEVQIQWNQNDSWEFPIQSFWQIGERFWKY